MDGSSSHKSQTTTSSSPNKRERNDDHDNSNQRSKKRQKWDGGRGGRGRGGKSKNMGRSEYFRQPADTRNKNESRQKKKERDQAQGRDGPIYATKFSKEEITSEDRRPKRKVAVMIGYSGTGYKGMQIMPNEKTIEGDLFKAFVAAGAISKANADDPKKSQLIRCARTDKGVHAAGNVISLKLIIEDDDIVQKINENLPEQIRVWGVERTVGSFSCYSECDSRWYEYLIPTYAFLPPHPSSFLSKEIAKFAAEDGKTEEWKDRQKEVMEFWDQVEMDHIQPILETLDMETRNLVEQAIYHTEEVSMDLFKEEDEDMLVDDNAAIPEKAVEEQEDDNKEQAIQPTESVQIIHKKSDPVEIAIKQIKAAYITAKNNYRISAERIVRVREVLAKYPGTHNFHNFTIRKGPRDPSAKRFIRSFEVNGDPVIINGTEWLSLKVHGQSFMMHQIRKMVAMAALIVRCGTEPDRIRDAMTYDIFNIPKAPGLGLLLERPVFETYNKKAVGFDRPEITFEKYEEEMLAFKQREIYDKIFQVEAEDNVFHTFFAQIDNFRMPHFLYLSSKGFEASKGARNPQPNQPTRKERQELGKERATKKIWGDRARPEKNNNEAEAPEQAALDEATEASAENLPVDSIDK